jgi:Fe-Mn family superoxide dismutase
MEPRSYKVKSFTLSRLKGISDKTLEMHFGLYEGYVKNTNLLTQQLFEITQQRKALATNPAYTELKRHLGFEYGGMVLHEYYFGNLFPNGRGEPAAKLVYSMQQNFGAFDLLRGVGWAVLYEDPATGQLSNHWIELHHQGVPTGFKPILVMDVWEHAFLLDYKTRRTWQVH